MKKKSRKKDKMGISIIALSILLLATPFALKMRLTSNKQQLDNATLCPTGGETHRTTVLIDKSDAWGTDDIDRVQTLLYDVYKKIPTQGRLTIYGIIGDNKKTTEVKRFFDFCNPGNEQECNALYQNCSSIKKRFESAFAKPLSQLTESLKLPGESSYSPLLESLAQITDEADGNPLEVYIVSDMVENHYKFRFYKKVPPAEEMIKEYPLSKYRNISVNIRHIQRSRLPKKLELAVVDVWAEYFEQQGIAATFERLFIAD